MYLLMSIQSLLPDSQTAETQKQREISKRLALNVQRITMWLKTVVFPEKKKKAVELLVNCQKEKKNLSMKISWVKTPNKFHQSALANLVHKAHSLG